MYRCHGRHDTRGQTASVRVTCEKAENCVRDENTHKIHKKRPFSSHTLYSRTVRGFLLAIQYDTRLGKIPQNPTPAPWPWSLIVV